MYLLKKYVPLGSMYGGKNISNANKEYSETSKLIRQLQSNSSSLKNGEEKMKLSLPG